MSVTRKIRKLKNQLLGFITPYFSQTVSPDALESTKLVMTLLVKNEIDIVRETIEFHLKFGVDYIIATDNNSSDGTLAVLKEYERYGILHLIQEPSDTFNQAAWVNRMGELAVLEYNADIVFHCDADEFWKPISGNLKTELLACPKLDVLKVSTRNVILADLNGKEAYPGDARYVVKKVSNEKQIKKISNNRYLNKTHRKVMFRASRGMLYVGEGNHRVLDDEYRTLQNRSSDIMIYHFPSRGKIQFHRKVVEGGQALAKTEDIPSSTGSHWRMWYESYENGQLNDEYASMVLSEEAAEKLIALDMIEINRFFPADYCYTTHRIISELN